jgi:hypothetical protein
MTSSSFAIWPGKDRIGIEISGHFLNLSHDEALALAEQIHAAILGDADTPTRQNHYVRWTPERIEELTQLYAKGERLAVIAKKMGFDGAGSISNQITRLGLANRNAKTARRKAA